MNYSLVFGEGNVIKQLYVKNKYGVDKKHEAWKNVLLKSIYHILYGRKILDSYLKIINKNHEIAECSKQSSHDGNVDQGTIAPVPNIHHMQASMLHRVRFRSRDSQGPRHRKLSNPRTRLKRNENSNK